ncbi:alpha-ketoglutaric semialdehyde dehydrogenase GucD [Sporosarcina luteola]|uniref:alpha-ketoglutaric semialdehyde dehydrogenase GucD n=1 Tax=Sporosarcina luteola TaxID=582850 RepID=UPI00203DCDC0|nr:alpha-ketoglutaric semialdehyde dehydrogenase GucD [Sporosarcina luteola]MCM3709137.1 aldehyde dehydrogenase family protein [Sporosarcina luteola]
MTILKSESSVCTNYIGGEWVSSPEGDLIENINPATGELVCKIQSSTSEDVKAAVLSAEEARKEWNGLTGAERGKFLYAIASKLEERKEEIAESATLEMGKTYPETVGEVQRAIDIFKYYAGEGVRSVGDVVPSTAKNALLYTTRTPIGTVAVITPWNFPIAIPAWKIAPALIYGNTVVFKPAQEAPLTATKLVECMEAAGLPKGVINLVHGKGSVVGPILTESKGINGISFTGSNAVGKSIGKSAFENGIKFQLEMGGKNPIIILEDADLDLAVDATLSGGMKSTGQKCTATSKVIVHEGIYNEFKIKLLEKVKTLQVGNGLDSDSWLGPCASERQMKTVLSYIEKGKSEGADLIFGGNRIDHGEFASGFYVEPAVFENVDSKMTIAREEIFGPVIALMKVSNYEEAIEYANDTSFGLSASVFTKNIGNILQFVRDIEVGLVRVNSETAGVEYQVPFGGMKESSSHSREQGQAAIEFYTSVKTVFIQE